MINWSCLALGRYNEVSPICLERDVRQGRLVGKSFILILSDNFAWGVYAPTEKLTVRAERINRSFVSTESNSQDSLLVTLPDDDGGHVGHVEQPYGPIRTTSNHHRAVMVVGKAIHAHLQVNLVLKVRSRG